MMSAQTPRKPRPVIDQVESRGWKANLAVRPRTKAA